MLISTSPDILNLTSISSSPAGDLSASSVNSASQDEVRAKLPKLGTKRFNGKLTEWQAFINCFDRVICLNSKVSDIDKMKYLISLLDGPAAAANVGINKVQHSKGAAGTKVGK